MKRSIGYVFGSILTVVLVAICHEFISDLYAHFLKKNTNIIMTEVSERLDENVDKEDVLDKIKDMITTSAKEENKAEKIQNIGLIFNQIVKVERDFYRILSAKYLSCLTIFDVHDDKNANNMYKCGLSYKNIEKDFDKCYANSKILYKNNKDSQKKSEHDCKAMLLLKIKQESDKIEQKKH